MSFQVSSSPPLEVGSGTITNAGDQTVYYRDELPVSSSVNDGSLAPAASVTVTGSAWVVAGAGTRSAVTFTPASQPESAQSGSGLPDDGTVGDVVVNTAPGEGAWMTPDAPTNRPFLASSLTLATDLAANQFGGQSDGSTVLQAMTLSLHTLRRAGTSICLVYANFTDSLGSAPTDTISIRAGVDVAGGAVLPVYFGGKRDVTIEPEGFVISDPVASPHVAGYDQAVRTLVTVEDGDKINFNRITVSGDGVESGVTTTDKTTSGTVTASTSEYAFAPYVVLTDFRPGDSPVVIAQGDSINFGYNDTPFSHGAGAVYRALNGSHAFLNMAVTGDSAQGFLGNNGHRTGMRRLFSTVGKYVVSNYGTNDIENSRTLAQLQADVLAIATWNAALGQGHFQTTLIPRTTSDDDFVTTSGQAPVASEAVRLTYNAWLRDGSPIDATTKAAVAVGTSSNVLRCAVYSAAAVLVTAAGGAGHPFTGGVVEFADTVESARNSGFWLAHATPNFYTDDGTHPKSTSYELMKISVPTALFV